MALKSNNAPNSVDDNKEADIKVTVTYAEDNNIDYVNSRAIVTEKMLDILKKYSSDT